MLKLTTPKSFLRFAKNMTVGELKNVTNLDLLSYKAEMQATICPDMDEDLGTVNATNMKMVALAVSVYGEGSKQHKYLTRNFSKGECLVDLHYNMFAKWTLVETWISNSKTGSYADYCVPGQGYERKEGS